MRRNRVKAAAIPVLAVLLAARPAYANCIPAGSVEDEFKHSTVVFMGTVIGSRREPIRYPGHPGYSGFMEFADFQVDIGWKGVQPGEVVHFKTNSGSGETYNVRNDPPIMLWETSRWTAKNLRPPTTASNTWIIFAWGKPPYELSTCTRSLPINWQEPSLAVDLDKIARKNAHH